jgi:hypothetical protein
MVDVVDLAEWRRDRDRASDATSDGGVGRLERAIDRLHEVVGRTLDRGRLPASVETELLAIMGELSMGGLDQAERRAERLTRRLLAGERGSG